MNEALATEDSSEDDLIALKDPTPSLPPTDISLVRFADDLERPSQEVLFRRKLTQFHLRRTISLLNKSLSQKNSHENEAIFHVILTLAMIASLWGDFDSAAVHLSGLQQIVRLRGGLEYLHRFPKLHFKLDRLALTWALGSGGIPSFFTGPVSWSPYFERSLETRTNTIEVGLIEVFADTRLAVVFQDLRHLVCLVNNHLANNSRLDGLLFQDCLGSVQARLVHLQGDLEDASDECLRLGMLAFLSTTLQIPGGKFPYAYLAAKFRMAYSMHGTMGQFAFSKARELGNGATEAILEP
ncbi:hypothetical protein K4K58_009709 [Colletotrichum sp. SAR11_239]|nr:hypothetical protein K4K58_009709 [Colletotrichum sp. SAR11_239]